MHIGVCSLKFVEWGGGVGFIENLLYGLAAVPDKVTRITVFVPTHQQSLLRSLLRKIKRAVRHPSQAKYHLWGTAQTHAPWQGVAALFRTICPDVVVYDGSVNELRRHCQRLQVDVVLPSATPLINFGTPWVGYLYDCQHKHYPQFFKPDDAANRDRDFARMLHTAKLVLVNARAVVADLETFFPDKNAKVVALPFAPVLRAGSIDSVMARAPVAQQTYGTGTHYFIICNQFWVHKDHSTALQAFAQATQDPSLHSYKLVCTGVMDDYRHPGYCTRLQALCQSLHIADRVVFTGYIDKQDQLALLYGATAMVQPTLFEGGPGGGAAFDSVAMGVPSVLSDIPVNLEINDPSVTFFKTGNPVSLAHALRDVATAPSVRPPVGTLLQRSGHHARTLGLSLFDAAASLL